MSGIIDLTGDDESAPSSRPPVADPSDSEDEDLKLAIALSLQDQKDVEDTRRERLHANEAIQSSAANTVEPQTTSGLLGLDRKTMEAERLARLKRKREVDVQEEAQNQKSVSVEKTPASPPPARKQKTNLMTMTTSTMSAAGPKPNFVKSTALSRAFTDPQVLLTSSPSRLTSSGKYESISFPDILHPPSPNHALKSVLLSSFVADLDWALPHFNTRTTKFLIILHAHNAQHRALLSADFVGLPNVKLVLPEIIGAGTMHSKLMLLFYHQHSDRRDGERDGSASDAEMCRVVVPSANLTPADWGVGGIMENVLFVVDLPLKAANPNPGPGPGSKIYHFENGLKDLLRAMDVPERVRQKIDRFDFEATENVRFVFSRSGSSPVDVTSTAGVTDTSHARGMQHIGNFFENRAKKDDHGTRSGRDTSDTTVSSTDVTAKTATPSGDRPSFTAADATSGSTRTGLLSLHDAVVSLGLDLDPDASPSDPAHAPYADFVTSSLGNLSSSFATQLYLAICGRLDPTKVGGGPPRSRKPKTKSSADGCDDLDGVLKEKLKIYFPTSETVLRSRGGPSAAGTICFREKWWDSNDLIRNCLYDCVGVRGDGILMHSKVCGAIYLLFCGFHFLRGAMPSSRGFWDHCALYCMSRMVASSRA